MASPGTIESKCVTKITKRFRDMGSDMSRDDVSDVINELSEMAREKAKIDKAGHTAGDYGRQLFLAARELTEREKLAQIVEKRQRAINIIRREDLMSRISEFGVSPDKALAFIDIGSARGVKGSALSLDALGATYEKLTLGRLQADLRTDNVDTFVRGTSLLGKRDVAMERKVAQEQARQNGSGTDAETHDRNASKVAQIFNKHIEAMRRDLNRAGAFISKAEGYIIGQTHDQFKIAKAGFDKWYGDTIGKLAERTFVGVGTDPVARKEWLQSVYNNLETGNHLKDIPTDGGIPGFKGPGNLAKRLGASRSLHFKSGGDWFDYNELYGHGNLFEGIISQLERHARNRAVMETYGPNPEAMRDSIIDRLIVETKKANVNAPVAALEAMKRRSSTSNAQFRSAAGIHLTGNPTWARRAADVRATLNMSSLGTSILGQFADLAANAAVLRHNGMNMLEAVSAAFRSLPPGAFSGNRREFAETMGAMTDGFTGSIHSRFSPNDVPGGLMTRMQSTFFKLNGQQWWQDRLSGGLSNTLAKNMAVQLGKDFADIPRRLRTNLGRYGVTATDWTELQNVALTMDGSDRYLMTDAIEATNPDLAKRMSVYYYDQVREGMTIPGARERGWSEQFGERGTWGGEGARFALQFKSFVLSYTNKHLGRELLRDGVDFSNLGFLIALSFPLGYLSLSAKDMLKGREPRDTKDAKTWMDSFAQAGGAGIYGDALFGNSGDSGILSLAGPAVTKISDLFKVYGQVRDNVAQGKAPTTGMAGNVAGIVGNSMPFANLIGFRQALDWMVLYQATEWLSPGALAKREQNLRRRTGQTMLLSPSKAIPRGGGDRVFEGLR